MSYRRERIEKSFGLVALTLMLWFTSMSGCAGKKPVTTEETKPPTVITTPTTPTQPPPPQVYGPPLPPDMPEIKKLPSEKPHVGLVIGGAGVASFATVGLLKRLQEEGVQVDYIVSTGWPALFAVGYGFLRSVHDLEWFAMRLQEKDFYSSGGFFEVSKGYASHDRLSTLIENSFPQHDLAETRIPVIISAGNTEPGAPEIFDKGDWKAPLLKTMSVPGIYQPYPETSDGDQGTSSLSGLDVEDAVRRGAKVLMAISMYDDYFTSLKGGRKGGSDSEFRKLYLTQMKNSIAKEFKQAQLTGKIVLGKAPNDFTAKRLAILSGYKEGARLARQLRSLTVN